MQTPELIPNSVLATAPLDADERARLEKLESIISQGLQTFYEVGKALDEICHQKLYRETHKTFEAYCREKWGIARRTAYQFIDAAQVMENLCANGAQIPTSERQVRPLRGLSPQLQVEIWQKAVVSAPQGSPSGAAVKRLVDEQYGRQTTKPYYGEDSSELEDLRQENKRLRTEIRQRDADRERRAAEVVVELERLREENRQLRAELRQRDRDWESRIALERAKIREELRAEVKAEYEGQINALTAQVNSLTQQLEEVTAKYQTATEQIADMTTKYEFVLARLEAIEGGK